jgi:hypothetical protein
VELAGVITKHLTQGVFFWMSHADYHSVFDFIAKLPDRKMRVFKNPYFLGFLSTIGNLLLHVHSNEQRSKQATERLEILFDEGVDRPKRLREGYRAFVDSIKRKYPEDLELLVNKEAQFRDDKVFLPLQASDLLAWHVRRSRAAKVQGLSYRDPIWTALQSVPYHRYHYSLAKLEQLVVMTAQNVSGTLLN